MIQVKICGITNVSDALAAAEAGADAIGLVFAESPRKVSPVDAVAIVQAAPREITKVGVFMDQPVGEIETILAEVPLNVIQLHGSEPPGVEELIGAEIIKRVSVDESDTRDTLRRKMEGYHVDAFLLDPGAGSGRTFDWSLARDLAPRVFISGGLTPQNVGQAIRAARPFGVDASSGLEARPGRKDAAKMKAFVQAVREAQGA